MKENWVGERTLLLWMFLTVRTVQVPCRWELKNVDNFSKSQQKEQSWSCVVCRQPSETEWMEHCGTAGCVFLLAKQEEEEKVAKLQVISAGRRFNSAHLTSQLASCAALCGHNSVFSLVIRFLCLK